MARDAVARRIIHHMDFDALVGVNEEVVSLTKEAHEYSPADGRKLRKLVKDVEQRAKDEDFEDALGEKAALLVYDIARGQYFRAGNKRTALVAGLVFLKKNGSTLDIKDPLLVATVDKAGIAATDLETLHTVMSGLLGRTKPDRKGWDSLARGVVDANKAFLTALAS